MIDVTVPAFAKLNLDLRVLHKRADGFHEIRSVFQTISLADRIRIRARKARETRIAIDSDIPDNLIVRAARACLEELRVNASIEFTLDKRIPMGAGLGGGSSDAAAILHVLPALLRKPIDATRLHMLAAALGSDVPFFLLGGTAVVMGRGDELYPVPDRQQRHVLVVAPGIHVSTPDAYRALSARLTPESAARKLADFQANVCAESLEPSANDFEEVVFEQHPEIGAIRKRVAKAGATTARMTGSGSSVFGVFATRQALDAAAASMSHRSYAVRFLTRSAFRAAWHRSLIGIRS